MMFVARHRSAALGQLGQDAGRTRHRDADVLVVALPDRHGRRRRPLGDLVLGVVGAAELGDQPLHDVARRDVTLAHRGVQRGHVVVAQFTRQGRHRLGTHQALQRKSAAAHFAGDGVLAGLQRLLAALLGEPLPDLGLGPRRHHEALPVPRRPGVGRLGGENLYHFAVFELALQRHQPAVDPGADTAVADLGVHRVGEVHRRGPGRQRDHVALRGEHEDLVRPRGRSAATRGTRRGPRPPAASRAADASRPCRRSRRRRGWPERRCGPWLSL